MRHPEHRKIIPLGKQELYSHYTIQVAEIISDKNWRRPDAGQ